MGHLIHLLSTKVNQWVERSLALLGLTMACVVIVQVFCRYVLNSSLFWSEELARYLLVWPSFLGATAAYHRRLHPRVDVLTTRLSGNLSRGVRLLVHLFSSVLFGVMVYHGAAFAYFVRFQISPALAIPKWFIFMVIPISGIIFFLHLLWFMVDEFSEEQP